MVLVVVAAAGCGSSGPTDYDAQVEREFVESCVEEGGEDLRDVCECTYGKISEQIPFERFDDIDRQIADQEEGLPDDVIELITDCVIETSTAGDPTPTTEVPTTTVPPTAPPTTVTPTTAAPPATTTTTP